MSKFQLNIPISKVDEEQRIVYGYATKEELDRQGDIVDYEAAKKAFNEWAGNIREQHDPKKAVGKRVHTEFDDDNKQILIGAYVSKSPDGENAWTKVKENILTGFSIGGKIFKTVRETVKTDDGEEQANRIVDFSLSEVSLVDVPACPSAQFVMVKSVDGQTKAVEEMHEAVKEPWFFKHYAIAPDQVNRINDSDNTINMSKQSKELEMSNKDDLEKVNVHAGEERDANAEVVEQPKEKETAKVNVLAGEERDNEAKPVETEAAEVEAEAKTEEAPKTDKEEPKVEEKADKPEIKKGLYSVANLADCVANLTWIVGDAEWEALYAETKGEAAAQLKAAVAQVADALVALTQEAVDDLKTDGVVELADQPTDLVKMVSAEIDAKQDEMVKALSGKMEDIVKAAITPLEDRLKAVESQPVGDAPKTQYTVIEKAEVQEEGDELSKTLADMEANPGNYTALDRADIAAQLFKRNSRTRPVIINPTENS